MGKREIKQAVKDCLDQYAKLEKCIKDKNRIHWRNTRRNIYMEKHLMSL